MKKLTSNISIERFLNLYFYLRIIHIVIENLSTLLDYSLAFYLNILYFFIASSSPNSMTLSQNSPLVSG